MQHEDKPTRTLHRTKLHFLLYYCQFPIMPKDLGETSFLFIDSSDKGIPMGDGVRMIIRKQAMSRVAAVRRQKGSCGKKNLRQNPNFESIETTATQENISSQKGKQCQQSSNALPDDDADLKLPFLDQSPFSDSSSEHSHLTLSSSEYQSIPASLSSTGYEALRIQHDCDLLDLSALTTFHVSRVTAQILSEQPSKLKDVLRCRQWSYFSYLPSRLGYSACLDDAANCIASRVREFLVYPTNSVHASVLQHYSRAVKSLHAALDNPSLRFQPEVLCAAEILAIYEVSVISLIFREVLLTFLR